MAEAQLLAPVRATFRAVACTVVPEADALDEAGWRELESIVETALAERPARMRRQLVTLIRLIEWAPLARYGHRFSNLDLARRTRVLAALQDGRVLLLRRGVWGLRTLVFMGYYARPSVDARIGYSANLRGWMGRPDAHNRAELPPVPPAKEVGPLGGALHDRRGEMSAPEADPASDPDLEISP